MSLEERLEHKLEEKLEHKLEQLEDIERKPSFRRSALRLLLLLVVTALLLWFLFRRIDTPAVFKAWGKARHDLLVFSLGLGILGLFVANVWSVFEALRSVGFRGRWWRFFLAVSALQLPGTLQVHLAGAGFLAYLKRRYEISVRHGIGTGAVLYFCDGCVFALVCLPAFWTVPGSPGAFVSLAGVFLVGYHVFAYGYLKGWWNRLWPERFRVFLKPREWEILRPAVGAAPGLFLRVALLRLFAFAIMAASHAGALAAFSVEAPFALLLVAVPMMLFLGNLPVTFGGFGTTQAAAIFLLGAYATEEALFAYSLAYSVGALTFRALLGAVTFAPGWGELTAKAAPVSDPGP